MIKAVLLDLDNTLLDNPQDVFVREYLQAVDTFFQKHGQQTLSASLLQSMGAMTRPRDLRLTNADVIIGIIHKNLARAQEEILPLFTEFYQTVYPALQRFTRPIPFAAEVVNHLQQQGLIVVVATNPLYPADAIYQRLTWANLSLNSNAFALVTHGENMHYAKPDSAYFGEILARVGVEPDETLMVGDSSESDIIPAAEAGLHTYQIKSASEDTFSGTMEDLYTLICNEDWVNSFPVRLLQTSMIAPEMRGSLGALYGLLSEVQPHHWHQHPDPNEWSVMQIVCHLLESEQALQRPRLQRILNEVNPFLTTSYKPAGADTAPCADDGYRIADAFVHERTLTMDLLRSLRPEDWLRRAHHSIFGPTTLLEMAHFTAQHDRLHLKQFRHTLDQCQ
ncbi:MAG: HAD-IA family hydrolase [Anaerolineae bacterium]